MEDIRLKILKTSETGKQIVELLKRRDLHFKACQELAKELGFKNSLVSLGEIRGEILIGKWANKLQINY